MLTIGLSFHELERITKILDSHGVHYEVGGDRSQEPAEDEKAPKAKPKGRGNTSFYEIEIPDAEFSKLPATAVTQLADLGVFPEMEVPDFGPETTAPAQPAPKKPMSVTNWIMLTIIILVLFMIVKKRVSGW